MSYIALHIRPPFPDDKRGVQQHTQPFKLVQLKSLFDKIHLPVLQHKKWDLHRAHKIKDPKRLYHLIIISINNLLTIGFKKTIAILAITGIHALEVSENNWDSTCSVGKSTLQF